MSVLSLLGCDRSVDYGATPGTSVTPGARCGDGQCQLSELAAATACPADCEDASGNVCGDRKCGPDESCPADCDGCGDSRCADGESPASCPEDCGEGKCGDGVCADGEDPRSCPEDCDGFCGDGICNGVENGRGCPEDCAGFCGDGRCGDGEDARRCPQDCGYCGDGFCGAGEDPERCFEDCQGSCGDGICDGDESPRSCPEDCRSPFCGNGQCDRGEGPDNCPQDCNGPPPDCGDGICQLGENPFNCDSDCAYIDCQPFVPAFDNGCPDPGFQTCFPLDELSGVCLQSGDRDLGELCATDNPDAFVGECVANGVCVPDRADGLGTCRGLCRSFVTGADSGCAAQEACAVVGAEPWGYCTDEVTSPRGLPLDPCSVPQTWCDDASICLEVDQAGNSLCIKLCRLAWANADCPDALLCEDVFADGNLGACIPQ